MSFNTQLRKLFKLGFTEKDSVLQDGTIIHYGESPDNGKTPLLLFHGQTGAWQDYTSVLSSLAQDFHVFALDCHGHGKSSKNPQKYSAQAICQDIVCFIDNIIKAPVVISGHSSGGLISAWFAANYPDLVLGLVLEDPPFFSTEHNGRWEKSFAYVDTYEPMHRFLNQSEETDWVLFYLKNARWGKFVGEKGMTKMIEYGTKYRTKHHGQPLHYFFLPDSINNMFRYLDEYDLRFGEAFYNGSWFEGYDQSEVLRKIQCPSILIHTKWSIDEEGILMAAMSGEDAATATKLIRNCELIKIDSGHNSHAEKPQEFLRAFSYLKQLLHK